jgi:LysR family transcriptional regulator, glycine cleavage system transcriptional activator
MTGKRYRLPPLGFFQGFEAAARNLSFTRAAAELFITQSAVSRQIKALEDYLGVPLFERRPRSLVLTESGQMLYGVATEVLERLQSATDRLKGESRTRQVSVTTTTGFASLWLIPRLRRFTSQHPDVDVRISATIERLNLERSLIDLAIRYCKPDAVPEGAPRLFGEAMIPVCSPALTRDRSRPLRHPRDLQHHTLLHYDYPGAAERVMVDWGTWLTALGVGDLVPAGTLHFTQYEQMIQAAIDGQGVALGRQPLLNDQIKGGLLVAPFNQGIAGSRAYFLIEAEGAARKPQVREFAAWLLEEVRRDEASSRGIPDTLSRERGRRRARSVPT